MPTATNPTTGERVYLDEATGQWLPAKTATNPETGEKAVFDGKGWQPLPAAAAPAAPPVQPLDEATAAQQNPAYQSPSADQALRDAQPTSPTMRGAKLDAQAMGGGVVGAVLGIPDLITMGAKGLDWGVDKAVSALGYEPVQRPSIPLPSDTVKNAASWAAQKLGYEPATPEGVSEKLRYNALQFGTEALGGAAALSRAAIKRAPEIASSLPRFGDDLLRPYFEKPVKTVIGDTAAGATAGAALTGSQELPKSIRDMGGGAVGSAADLTAMLMGGASGGTLASAITGAPTSIGNTFRASRAANDVPTHPVTGAATSNMTADDAARILQSVTTNEPGAAAAQMAERVQSFKDQGMPVPTSGSLIEDIGLSGLEKRQRTKAGTGPILPDAKAPQDVREQYSFGKRDQAQRDFAAGEVQSVRPQGADPNVFPQRAQDVTEMRIEQAQRGVDQPTGQARGVQQAREGEAQTLLEHEGQGPAASRQIHDTVTETRATEQRQSREMYSDPVWAGSQVPIDPVQRRAADLRQGEDGMTPVDPVVAPFLNRIESLPEGQRAVTGEALDTLRVDIENAIQDSKLNGSQFRQLKSLKDSITESIDLLPDTHPGKQAIQEADANWRARLEPTFRKYAGEALDYKIKTDPGQVYPSQTGEKFLKTGEDAQQLMQIANLRGNAQEIAANTRTIVMDQLAQSGVIKDGVIDPGALTRWRNRNSDAIQHIPGLRAEVDAMVTDARKGFTQAGRYAEDITAAEARLAQTRQAVTQGPLGMVAGKDPTHAVGSILASDNPARNMADLKRQMGNNPTANQSLKAAVTDHFLNKIKTLDPHSDTEFGVKLNALMKEFEKHRSTLATVLSPEEMQALQRAQTVLKPLTKRNVQATVGSTTAESSEAALRPLELALKGYYGVLKGGGVFRTIKVAMKTLKGDNTGSVEELVTRAMFDPELAQTLLTRQIKEVGTPGWNAKLQKVIRRTEAARELARDDEDKAK